MSQPKVSRSRRSLFAGASTVGAIAAAATLIPTVKTQPTSVAEPLKPAPDKGGGYSLTDHVKQYYKTTLV